MEMTEAEIVRKYLDARYKTKYVKQLAELNACSTATIEGILKKNGVTYPPKPGPPKKEEQAKIDEVIDEVAEDKEKLFVEALEEQGTKKEELPQSVRALLIGRIGEIKSELSVIETKQKDLMEEVRELREFLKRYE